MAMDLKEIEKYIKEAMPDATIDIQDLAGAGNHCGFFRLCHSLSFLIKTYPKDL